MALRQIGGRQHAAGSCDVGGDRGGDLALVEILRPLFGEPHQGVGEATEAQRRRLAGGRADRRQVVGQPDLAALVIAPQILGGIGCLQCHVPIDRQPAAGQGYRRPD